VAVWNGHGNRRIAEGRSAAAEGLAEAVEAAKTLQDGESEIEGDV
jgi:hypothetical protein